MWVAMYSLDAPREAGTCVGLSVRSDISVLLCTYASLMEWRAMERIMRLRGF
jgi:hypothetical protein